MAEELQGLLDRISQDGFQKVEAEKERLLAEARKEAEKIVADGREEAKKLVAEAQQEASTLERSGKDNLRQAARDVTISLKGELSELLDRLLRTGVAEAADHEFLAQLVLTMAGKYAEQQGGVESVEVLVNQHSDLEQLESLLKAKLQEQFKAGLKLTPVPGIAAGIQISFNGEALYHDLTDEAVAAMLGAYLNPRVLQIIEGE